MVKIYLIRNNVNDIVYIGQTSKSLENRLQHHFSNENYNTKFYNAIKEIGRDHFTIELIEEVSEEYANEREMFWLNYYSSFKEVYNTKFTIGKCGGDTLTNHPNIEEIRKKISTKALGGGNSQAKKVLAVDLIENTKIPYDSFSECQRDLSIDRHDIIGRRCKGIIKKPYNNRYLFEYID